MENCPPAVQSLCPLPCIENYTDWATCDCFNGSQWRTYLVLQDPKNGGTPCNYTNNTIFTQSCTPDPAQNCPNLGPTCVTAADCDDHLACTIDKCLIFIPPASSNANSTYHCDWNETRVCNDSSVCTSDHCDQLLGCVYDTTLFCNDNNLCTTDVCDNVTGCVNTNIVCNDSDVCNLGYCDPTLGCGLYQRRCNSTGNNCSYTYCSVNYTHYTFHGQPAVSPCLVVDRCAISGLIIGLTTGAVVGIIFAAILAGAMLGGGTYAAATAFSVEPTTSVEVNPLYQAQGGAGDNPLYGDDDNAP